MSLITLDLPSPRFLRGNWAAFAAICNARGWTDLCYATEKQWYYHDGGGNWCCLRFQAHDRVVLIGHDHEYSETYYGAAAKYFGEEETNLLMDAPDWWANNLNPKPFGEWIGFVYGWDGKKWQRAAYDKPDGFESVGLLRLCTQLDDLFKYAKGAPGLNGSDPKLELIQALVDSDAEISDALLESVVPGWNVAAGIEAAKKFMLAPIKVSI